MRNHLFTSTVIEPYWNAKISATDVLSAPNEDSDTNVDNRLLQGVYIQHDCIPYASKEREYDKSSSKADTKLPAQALITGKVSLIATK